MGSSLKSTARTFTNNRWDDPIKDETFTIPDKPARIRLFPKVCPVHSHYVEFYSDKKQGKTGYPELCLAFDSENEKASGQDCPVCQATKAPTEYLYGYCLSRSAQRRGVLQVQPIRLTPTLASKIMGLSQIVYSPESERADEFEKLGINFADPPDATDAKFGFDIFVSQTNKNGKTEYNVTQSEPTKITKEEMAAFQAYIDEGKDVSLMAKPKSRKEVVESLQRNGVIEGGAKQGGGRQDDDQPRKPSAQKVQQRASLMGDDDDDQVPATKPVVKPTRKYDLDDDADDVAPAATKPKARSHAPADEDEAPTDDD
jgi:hypothetical protein